MEAAAFYREIRGIVEAITAPSQRICDLLRTPGESHPQEAARIALGHFGTFKAAQRRILELRLAIEDEHRAARTATDRDPAPHAYRLAVLADLQNTMLWALVGDDFAATNLSASLDVDFGYLADRKIESVARIAGNMNQDPRSLALITDLATGIAIADILHFTITDEPRLSLALLEVKEGAANAAVLRIHDLFEKDDAEFEVAVKEFSTRYGDRGMRQLARFARQLQRADTYQRLVNTGRARDFVNDENRIIQLVPPAESYAPTLNAILDDFYEHDRRYAFFPVDHLYFGIFTRDETGPNRWLMDFKHSIYHDVLGASWETCCFGDYPSKASFEKEFPTYMKIPTEDVRFALQKPFLRPLALTGLSAKHVGDILSESLYLWLYVRDDAIVEALRTEGLDVRLSRRGHGAKHDRSMYQIDGKYIDIDIHDEHGMVTRLGARPVLRTIFSLQTLGSMIAQIKVSQLTPDMFEHSDG